MKKLKLALLGAVVGALALAGVAAAHVTVNPNAVPAGSFSRFAIRVPSELPSATVKVSVKLPAGLQYVSFQTKYGWKRTVTKQGGATVVTWTSAGQRIGPNEFDEFGMSAKVPAKKGLVLVFPAVQTYANGKVVRWIGGPSADEPAPRVTLTAPPRSVD